MNTAPLTVSDDDALTIYRAIPGEADEGKRTQMVGLLDTYTKEKRAAGLEPFQPSPEVMRAQTDRFERLYSSLDTVEANLAPEQVAQMKGLLDTSPDPVGVKARMVNMAYLKQQHGATLPPGWDGENWPAMRRAYAKDVLGIDKPEVSDTELFGAIGKRVTQKKEERVMLTDVVAKVQMAAFEGAGSWLEAYEGAAKGIDTKPGYDPKARDTYRAISKRAFEQVKETADRLRPVADQIVGSLAREQGTREGFEDVRGFSIDELVAMVKDVPDKERPLLYSIVAQMAGVSPETADAKDKGLGNQTGESVARGFADVMRANKRALADNPALINARALAGAADRVEVTGRRKAGESLVDWATRSMRGNYGAVDLVKDVVTQNGQPFLRDRRKLTEDEQAALKDEVGTMEQDRAIRSELRQIAEGVVDPIKGSNFFTEKVYYPALQNAAYTGQAFIPFAGLPLLISSTVGMRSEEMMNRGMTIEDAQKAALVSGVLEAPVEMMQAKMVTGAFPIFKGLLEAPVAGLTQVAGRAAAVFGVQLLEQNAQEAIQDAMPLLIQHVASKLSDSVPGLDWNKELADYGNGRVDTFWALMPMVLVGTGSATFSDAAYGRQYLNDLTALKAAGFTEEAAAKIIEAPTLEEKQAIVRASWNDERLRVMNSEAQLAAQADMDADMREAYVDTTGDGARISRLEDGSFEVTTPAGDLVDIASDADAALELARDWNRADNLNMETAIQDMVVYVESFQEQGQSIEVVQGSRSLQDRVDAGDYTADEAEAIVDMYVSMGRLDRGATADDALITGENNVTRYDARRRIVSDVSRIYEGGNPLTVVEEHAEGYLKRRLADGTVTLEDLARWRESVDGVGNADTSERALKEWFSEQAQAYLVGKSDADAVPASFRSFLMKLKQYFTRVMDLAVRLMEKERVGELPDGFKKHLARSVGLDEAFIDAQHRADEAGQMGGRGEELMGWLKGKLPHPETARANGEALAGELQTVWEGFKSSQAARAFFAPKGQYTPLDQLAGMAKDDGFPFETADDLLQAIDSSLRGVEVFAEAGTGETTFSLSPEAKKSLPDWAREQMVREGLNPNRKFNDADLENQSLQDALRYETPEALAAEGIVEKDGRFVYERKPVAGGDRTFSVTDSKEFKAWFGNSKVVDAQGKPLVVYHGTTSNITQFDTGSMGKSTGARSAKRGFFFTTDGKLASDYTGVNGFLSGEDYDGGGSYNNWETASTGANVMPVYLKIENPLIHDFKGEDYRETSFSDLLKKAKADGHDGAIFKNSRDAVFNSYDVPSDIYVAFDPTQIKSATGNSGAFDPANPDITMAMESRRRVDEIHDEMKMRRVAARVVAGEHAGESFAPAIRKAMEGLMYQVVPNKETVAEALKIVDTLGVSEAVNVVMSHTSDYPASVQVALGLSLMEHFNSTKNYGKASEVGERVAELGTELGRGVQVFSLLGKVLDTPEKAQIFLSRQVKKLEKAMRDRQPAIDAAKEVMGDVQAEALKLLEGWLDQINGVTGRPAANRKPARVEDLPDLTFSLTMDMRKSGIVSVVSRMLKDSGAVETRKALVERYGDKIMPFVPDLFIEAQKQLVKRSAPARKPAKDAKKKGKEGQDRGSGKSGPRLTAEQVDAALADIRTAARKSDVQLDLTAIDEHFQGKRMTPEQVDDALAMSRAMGLGEQTTLDGLEAIAQRLEDEVIARMRVRGFETPASVRDAIRSFFDTKGVKFTREDVAKVFAEKFKVPVATDTQRIRLAGLAENIRSTPEFSTERTDATVAIVNHVNDILKPADVIDLTWAVWYANVLSGYNTHFRNMYANVLEQTVALPLDAVRVNPVVTLRLMREMLYGVKAGVSIGLREGKGQMMTGNASVLQTDSNKFGTAGTLERVKFAGGNANPFNWLKVVGRALRAEDLFAYATASEAKARMVAWEMATSKRLTGEAREAEIERLLNATEQQIGDFTERAGREWDDLTDELRVAKEEEHQALLNKAGVALGIGSKTARERWVNRRVSELRILERDAALIERASEFAARATFNYKPDGMVGVMANSLTDWLTSISNIEASGRFEMWQKALAMAPRLVVPFVRIVANVLNRGIDYTGLGAVRSVAESKLVGSVKSGVKFQAKSADERAMELKRGIFGIVTLGVLSAMADPDDPDALIQIHGSGAGSRAKNQALNGPRWMPYSIEIRTDEGSKFITYQYSPLLMGLALVGNWHDSKRYRKLDEKDELERLATAATGIGSVLLDQSFLSNAADLVNMFGRDGQVSTNALYSFLGRTFNPATVAVPFSSLLRQMERDFDPVARDRPDIMASLMSNVPVASRFNEPALDVLGDPIANRPFDWFVRASADGTPEARIYRAFAEKDAVPTGIWTYKGKMEPEQFYQFTKERGAFLKESLMRNDAQLLKAIEDGSEKVAAQIVENISRTATQVALSRVGYVPKKTK